MRRKQASGGIERKFLTSILWVGVIPMALALVIGYVFARAGQQVSVQGNLSREAGKTAEGVQLAFSIWTEMAGRMAGDPQVVEALRALAQGGTPDLDPLLRRLAGRRSQEDDIHPAYSLYGPSGEFLASSSPASVGSDARKVLGVVNRSTVIEMDYLQDVGRYAARAVSPVRDSQGQLLGYLSETHGVRDLIKFVLGYGPDGRQSTYGGSIYELAVFPRSGDPQVFYVDSAAESQEREVRRGPLDPALATRIRDSVPGTNRDAFTTSYTTRGERMRVLMAYHRLYNYDNIYILVYSPASVVYANVNLAAILTIVVSSLVIGLFCIIAYRFVNNNIIRPVSLLNEGAQIIRQGDLELKLVIGTGDEIEELASSFNKMAAALRHNIKQLEESEEKYRSLITSMRDGIYQTDPGGIMRYINPAGVEILGYDSAEEVIKTPLRDLFIEQMDYARVMNELEKHQFVERTRVWMKKPGSQAICVEVSCNRVFDEARGFVGYEGTFRDVTHSVRLEQESRERSERISAINQIANAINSSLEAGRVYDSIVVEVRKLVTFDYAAVALRHADDETFRTRLLWPEPANEFEASRLRVDSVGSCAAWVAQEERCLIVERLQEDRRFLAEFPKEIHSCLCVPLYATGRIIGTLNLGARANAAFTRHEVEVLEQMAPHVAVAIRNAQLLENLQHSLEEVTRAREKLHEVNEELKTLDEMKTNLLSNVSHELRTPLVAVMGYTDMILNRKVGPINEMQQEYLGISLRNIEKLVTLIENLLDFSRLHRGTEEVVFDTMDLVDCAKTSMQIIQPVADGREIQLILDCPEAEVLIEGDKGKLGQVFNNLLSNAVKFNHHGGSVTIQIRSNEDMVDISVVDSGIGIPEEAQDKIFTRFYQYDGSSTRKYGGTGIGLSIAQDIMRLHGSRITVSSREGEGCIFRFALPLSSALRERSLETNSSIPMPTETHLLVELVSQDRALSAQIRNLLLSEGMDVIHAAYPTAAITLANKYSPDCILIDSETGPLGRLVLDEILVEPAAASLPIILLSNDDDLVARYQHALSGRIKRGFRKSTLLSAIHYALSRGLPQGEQLGSKVLCVDDDSEIVTFISRCLEAEGFATDQCSSGEEALERARSGEYWLVLLDVAMPGIDGWETCEKLRQDPRLNGIKIYFVTAKPVDNNINRIHEVGADGYLLKPFRAEDLLAIVEGFELRQHAPNG